MATIKRMKKDESLTILTVSGLITRDEIIQAFEDFINHEVTTNLLWDFIDADLSSITRVDLEQIVMFSKPYAHLRKNGKTAFLVPKDLPFGLSRMYQTFTEIKEHPILVSVFRSQEEALVWLAE